MGRRALFGASAASSNWVFSPAEATFSCMTMCYSDDVFTNETFSTTGMRIIGTVTDFFARVSANSLSTAALTFVIRKNTANGNGTISVAASTTGTFTDAAHTDAIAVGDTMNAGIQAASGGAGTATVRICSACFVCNNAHGTFYGTNNDASFLSTASTTGFHPLAGSWLTEGNATENNVKMQVDNAGTIQGLWVTVSTNGRGTSTTWNSRINNANGNQTLSVGATATGQFQDTTNSDTLAVGDDINLATTTSTGGGTLSARGMSVQFTSMVAAQNNIYTARAVGTARAASGTPNFIPIIGLFSVLSTVETEVQMDHNFKGIASKFKIYLSANTYTVAGTANVRKNTADGNQTVSLTALTSGLFEDGSNTDSFVAGDDFAYQIVGGTTASATIQWLGMLESPSQPVANKVMMS